MQLLLSLLLASRATAAVPATYHVDSIASLQAHMAQARPGDLILLKNGTYTTTGPITVSAIGVDGSPVRIAAETVGGVTLAGAGGFDVAGGAAYVEIDGFVFRHRSGTAQVRSGASHIRFVHNVFECAGDGAYLTIAGDDTDVDSNEFRNKNTLGNMIDVRGAATQIAQRIRIRRNYFHDFTSPGPGTNGAETIRFGLSGLSMSKGLGVIEENLFVRCVGENELISIKSGSNEIRNNTLLDSPGAQLTLRHGNENIVRGNYLRGTDGIRIFGDRNRVSENYLDGNSGGIQIGNGDGEVADGAALTSHDRPDDGYITANVLVNNTRNIFMTGRDKGLGAMRTTIAHNVIQGGGPAAEIDGPFPGAIWRDNTVWQTAAGAIPADGLVEKKPILPAPTPLTEQQVLNRIRRR
jgi:poly(beta-D-mannuronate) lyase